VFIKELANSFRLILSGVIIGILWESGDKYMGLLLVLYLFLSFLGIDLTPKSETLVKRGGPKA
jgi:hypothetical protein